MYIETHGGTAIGGSDDHAGIDIGRTFTETPAASTPAEFLAYIRAGEADAHGAQGAKGLGELPIDGPAPAIVNAVVAATGVDAHDIPLTPERLMALLD